MMRTKFCGLCFFVAAAVALCSGTAGALPVYDGTYVGMYLKTNTFPDGLSEQPVYLDAAESSTITGHVGSQTGTPLVLFSSTTDTLVAANGYATIKAKDGYINSVTITAPGYYFEDLIFSVNLAPNANNNMVITVTDKSGGIDTFSGWTSLKDWVNGENRILELSTAGNLMLSVTITSEYGITGLGGGVDQLKQTEISGLTPVPEPGTLLLIGSGILGLAGLRRRFGA